MPPRTLALSYVRRVLVGGISGAGKSTLARTLARRLGVPYVELDALHHGPNWTKRPSFEVDVEAFSAGPAWVTDGQYQRFLGDLLWRRADTFLWLDFRRAVVMKRVISRSAARAIDRRELWNGNTESIRDWLDPEHPIRWAWSQHARRRSEYAERLADPRYTHLTVVRLRTPREAARWLAGVERSAAS